MSDFNLHHNAFISPASEEHEASNGHLTIIENPFAPGALAHLHALHQMGLHNSDVTELLDSTAVSDVPPSLHSSAEDVASEDGIEGMPHPIDSWTAAMTPAELTNFMSFYEPLYGHVNPADIFAPPSVPAGQGQPAVSQLAQQLQQHLQTASAQSTLIGPGAHVGLHNMQDLNNHNLADFIFRWSIHAQDRRTGRGPCAMSLSQQRDRSVTEVHYRELNGERWDIQGIDWADLGVTRSDARRRRIGTYRNYRNVRAEPLQTPLSPLRDDESFYRFRRMNLRHNVHLSHFQLRNLMTCATGGNIFYAGEYKVYNYNTLFGTTSVIMDLSDPIVQPPQSPYPGIQISTVAADSNVLIAGGFYGEYGMMGLNSSTKGHVEGLVTLDQNSITNHIQIHPSRASGLPQAIFASNDSHVRVLDCVTNQFVAAHKYEFAVNCTAGSPDRRLHCVVGDAKHVTIANAETGQIFQELEGHRDYGFACAWSDNGWHVATGNQDMTVQVWDARKWTNSLGRAQSLATIPVEMAGARSLRFSPVGSGRPTLVIAEPADVVAVVDAELFQSKQTLDFFGEIGGTGFGPGGHDLFVANCDEMRGGIIHYEACGSGPVGLSDYSGRDNSNYESWEWQHEYQRLSTRRRSYRPRYYGTQPRAEADVVGFF